MKIYTIWALLLLTGGVPVNAYHKVCYLHPQYGRKGSLHDLKSIMGKHFVYDPNEPVHYQVESSDGRRTCHIRLDRGDATRVRLFLRRCTADMPITEELVQRLMGAREERLKSVGLVLRDFRNYYKDITAQGVLCALEKGQE